MRGGVDGGTSPSTSSHARGSLHSTQHGRWRLCDPLSALPSLTCVSSVTTAPRRSSSRHLLPFRPRSTPVGQASRASALSPCSPVMCYKLLLSLCSKQNSQNWQIHLLMSGAIRANHRTVPGGRWGHFSQNRRKKTKILLSLKRTNTFPHSELIPGKQRFILMQSSIRRFWIIPNQNLTHPLPIKLSLSSSSQWAVVPMVSDVFLITETWGTEHKIWQAF